jgi:5'-3' exonuclease
MTEVDVGKTEREAGEPSVSAAGDPVADENSLQILTSILSQRNWQPLGEPEPGIPRRGSNPFPEGEEALETLFAREGIRSMKIHLLDGTYELFRAHHAMPSSIVTPDGRRIGAVRGLMQSVLSLLREDDVTHLACAFDHVILSYRNQLYDGYKTGEDTPPELLAQFDIAERAVRSLGVVVWPMVEFEADDAIATAAARWWDAPGVEQVVMASPDKDLAQMVRGRRIVALDRRREVMLDEDGVLEKFGVPPASIADYLALVGDSADGIPGIPRWGAKSAAAVLSRYGHIEAIPESVEDWDVLVRGAKTMAENLASSREKAMLYKRLATLRTDVPIAESLDDLRWTGLRDREFGALCRELGFNRISPVPQAKG